VKLTEFPHLVKEWHPTKNGELTPEDFTHGSKKKVWWLCPKGHTYEAMPNSRTSRNSGCPYCSGYKICKDNNLEFLYPNIAKEWHPTKNGKLTPRDIAPTTSKKFWWLCPKGHSYKSAASNRTSKNKTGCPYCSGNKVSTDNSLLFKFPETAKEWHPTKNGKLTPKDVTTSSTKKVWWSCNNGHSYETTVNRRTSMKTKCPYCSGRKVGVDNNLRFVHPEIAKEWHPTKNGDLKPESFTRASTKKVWWLCPKGHSYEATIHNRTAKNPTSCPKCSNQSSIPEIRILSELKWVFDKVVSRYRLGNTEIDIFLPAFDIGIEYDGKYWHKDKSSFDLKKNDLLSSKGIHLVRVREEPLPLLTSEDIIVGRSLDKNNLDSIYKKLYSLVDKSVKEKIDEYLLKTKFVNEQLFNKYRSCFPSPFPENSILKTHPLIAAEWDYEKNHPLTPENFSYGSGYSVWWICPKGHNYKRKLNTRTSHGTGCPYCSGRRSLTKDLFD